MLILIISMFRTFKEACNFYKFPGSHQVGSFGNSLGILRSYSNDTPGKDFFLDGEREILYKLKDDSYREKFNRNILNDQHVRVFRKVNMEAGNSCRKTRTTYVKDLGLFSVVGFKDDTNHVRMISVKKKEKQSGIKRKVASSVSGLHNPTTSNTTSSI